MTTKRFWSDKTISGKILFALLIALNGLFLVYWGYLSANYSLHYDDVHFMWKMREYSIWEYVREMYMTRGGNFVGYGVNGIIFSIANWVGDYHFLPMLTYLIGIALTWLIVRDINIGRDRADMAIVVLTLYNLYVLTNIDVAIFTWLCAMGYYLAAPEICLIVKYINKKQLKGWQWCLLVVLMLFVAGGSVSMSTVTFAVLFCNGLWLWGKEDWNVRQTWANPAVRRLIYCTLFMLVVFAIVLVAPGNYKRLESADDIEQPENIMQFVKACGICAGMFLYMMSFYLPYHLLAVALGLLIGSQSSVSLPITRKKAMWLSVGIFVLYLGLSVLPLAYLSNGFQIQRNYTHICFFYIALFFIVGFIWGVGRKNRLGLVSSYVFTLFMCGIMAINIYKDFPVAHAYHEAHIEREAYLLGLQQEGNAETVVVDPYPSTHMPDAKYNILHFFGKQTGKQALYYESDTGMVPNEYESHIRHLLKLDFDFVLPPKECHADE